MEAQAGRGTPATTAGTSRPTGEGREVLGKRTPMRVLSLATAALAVSVTALTGTAQADSHADSQARTAAASAKAGGDDTATGTSDDVLGSSVGSGERE